MVFNFIPANSAAWNPGVEHVFWTSEFKIVYQNSRLSTTPIFNKIKLIDTTIEQKYLELRQKSVDPQTIDNCSPALKTDQTLAYIALFKRKNKPRNVLNISRGTSIMASDTLPT